MNEYSLLDHTGKTLAMGTQDQMFGHLKHHVSDGRYRVLGPDLRLHCLRIEGVVMPDPDGVCLERANCDLSA